MNFHEYPGRKLIEKNATYANIPLTARHNLSTSRSDIQVLVSEYRDRLYRCVLKEDDVPSPFLSFAETRITTKPKPNWIKDHNKMFFYNTPNKILVDIPFLSEMGFIFSLTFSPDGNVIIVGHSSGLIQGTRNKILYTRWYLSDCGHITASAYAPTGYHIIVGHSTGLIQMRHGLTGAVLATLRNIQFPPKPVYSIVYSTFEERICYASCYDGIIYRIEVPDLDTSIENPPENCIKADPTLENLNVQCYGSPGTVLNATPYITYRSASLCMGVNSNNKNMIVGYADASIKIYDMETLQPLLLYKVHKLRLPFIPKALQRIHTNQVCALKCHDEKPYCFATGAWDKTLRIWDTRCKTGCVATFEGVDICTDSIDLNRDQCISGSWLPREALCVWDLTAKKKINTIRIQNRRPDVDGEFICACRYWKSAVYNRKGKYAIIGGSGTNCVEVINLHNRHIACSYPSQGNVLAIASHNERIAFGGTAPTFNIVSFYDPKHENYEEFVDEIDHNEEIETETALLARRSQESTKDDQLLRVHRMSAACQKDI